MKKLLIALTVIALTALAIPTQAQTIKTSTGATVTVSPGTNGSLSTNANVTVTTSTVTPTNISQLLGFSPSFQQLLSDATGVFNDVSPYITNDIVQIDTGILYNRAAKGGNLGAFADVNVPVSQQANVGFGGAYLDNTWLDATINIKLGTTFNWPVVGKVYAWVASGPDYNFKEKQIGAYDFAGLFKTWDIYHNAGGVGWNIGLNGGIGDISSFPGTCYLLGVSVNAHF